MYTRILTKCFKNKLAKLPSSDMEKKCSKSFFDASQSSDIEDEIIKKINTLKPFDMKARKAIPKKHFVLEENNCEEEISLAPQDRTGNINWRKCVFECKSVATFAESFCLFLRLKSGSAREASDHSAFMGNCQTISHRFSLIYLVDQFFFLFLVQLNKMRMLGASKVLPFCFWC